MISLDSKIISYINFGGYVINKVYYGANIVWEKIKTLVGWVNNSAWNNDEPWINT